MKDAKEMIADMLSEGWQVFWGAEKEVPCPVCTTTDYHIRMAGREFTEDTVIPGEPIYKCRNGHDFVCRVITFAKAI